MPVQPVRPKVPEAAAAWVQTVGKDLVDRCFSADWADREGALKEITERLGGPKPIAGRGTWNAYLGILGHAVNDKVRGRVQRDRLLVWMIQLDNIFYSPCR